MTRLLSRYAECLFWLARYMERAENLARILDVQETFARDSRRQPRLALGRCSSTPTRSAFFKRYTEATAAGGAALLRAPTAANPTSICRRRRMPRGRTPGRCGR